MNKIKAFFTLVALILVSLTYASDDNTKDKDKSGNENPVSTSFEGKFVYKGYSSEEISIVIEDGKHTEIYNQGEYKVVSKMNWISENAMQLEILENTLPESNIKVGDQMSIEIEKSNGDKFYYKSTYNDQSWKGCMIKVE